MSLLYHPRIAALWRIWHLSVSAGPGRASAHAAQA